MVANFIVRGRIAHTPADPFVSSHALVTIDDGALAIGAGVIAACGSFADVRAQFRDVDVVDRRGCFILPGFVDAHVHFPQTRVIGGLGRELLDWLERVALPEEARMSDVDYAVDVARRFVTALLGHGTTTALAFGAHFAPATAALFDEAARRGLRLTTGLVMSDRALRSELHQSPEAAYRASTDLIQRYHGAGRLRYAVTPRFALSTSEAMLEVCQALVAEHPEVRVQTHLNESHSEIDECGRLFPWAKDYLSVYERYGLTGARSVFAHNVHPTDGELERLAASATSIAHCPCSNAALGSGIFPFSRHLAAGVRCTLGTDVAGGTGFGMLKEALQAYLFQRVLADGVSLTAAHMLFLCTRAGALALGLGDEIGDFTPGRAADVVCVEPPAGSVLEGVIGRASDCDAALAGLFALGGAESVREVRIAGDVVYEQIV